MDHIILSVFQPQHSNIIVEISQQACYGTLLILTIDDKNVQLVQHEMVDSSDA